MKIKRLITTALLLCSVAGLMCASSPKREMRSIWMAAMGIDWPLSRHTGTDADAQARAKAALIEYLDNFKTPQFQWDMSTDTSHGRCPVQIILRALE